MTDLTKEQLESALDRQYGKITKDMRDYADMQVKVLKSHADSETEKLAVIVAEAFGTVDRKIDAIAATLDLRSQVTTHEKRLRKLEHKLGL